MFLSSGDRDVRVAFKVHVGSLASSRIEAKNSALLLSCDGCLLEPNEWAYRESNLLWRFERGLGIAL